MTASAPALAPDLVAGLRRLKLVRIRAIAPEVCQAAKTQRWAPDEFLRTLIEAEIASRTVTIERLRSSRARAGARSTASKLVNCDNSTSSSSRRLRRTGMVVPRSHGEPRCNRDIGAG